MSDSSKKDKNKDKKRKRSKEEKLDKKKKVKSDKESKKKRKTLETGQDALADPSLSKSYVDNKASVKDVTKNSDKENGSLTIGDEPYRKVEMSKQEIESFRKESQITVVSDVEYTPIMSFDQLQFPKSLLFGLEGFDKPTPIQSQCWPIAFDRRDIVGIAETGSGKTLAFSLPILYQISEKTLPKNPLVLILSPTRELANQTSDVLKQATSKTELRTTCLYGGVDKRAQEKLCRKGLDIVVATPGRLIDLFEDGSIDLSDVCYFVLDEADRMLDMGFEKHIRQIAESISKKRQTLMFSATWPVVVQRIAKDYLNNPVQVNIGSAELNANQNVQQIVEVIESKLKDGRLRELLQKYHNRKNKVIVFVLYKKEAARVENMLTSRGWNAIGIHSDKSQDQRTRALDAFKTGKCPILVATDVAARGLDVPDVEYVINYTFPLTIDDYIHRIGRTGRAGKKGVSHTLFTTFDKSRSGELIQVLKTANQTVPKELFKFGTAIKKPKPDESIGLIDINDSTGVLKFD